MVCDRVCVKLLYVQFVRDGMVYNKVVCVSVCEVIACSICVCEVMVCECECV